MWSEGSYWHFYHSGRFFEALCQNNLNPWYRYMSTGDKHQVTVFIALLRGGVNLGTACRLHPAQLPRAFLWLSLLPVGSGGLVAKSCCQAPLSMGFLRQEYWSRLPFPSPGDHPNSRIKPAFPALQAASCNADRFSTSEPPGKPASPCYWLPNSPTGESKGIWLPLDIKIQVLKNKEILPIMGQVQTCQLFTAMLCAIAFLLEWP